MQHEHWDETARLFAWQQECIKLANNGKETCNMAVSVRSDEEIQRDVLEELKWDSHVQPNEIGVAVKDGIVTLTGWGESYLKKMSAGEAAWRGPGLKAGLNDTQVDPPR